MIGPKFCYKWRYNAQYLNSGIHHKFKLIDSFLKKLIFTFSTFKMITKKYKDPVTPTPLTPVVNSGALEE
jgi:hypothetical protein